MDAATLMKVSRFLYKIEKYRLQKQDKDIFILSRIIKSRIYKSQYKKLPFFSQIVYYLSGVRLINGNFNFNQHCDMILYMTFHEFYE